MSLLEQSEDAWTRRYIYGINISNEAMVLGKEVAEALESGEATGDILKDFVISKIPKLDQAEKELSLKIQIAGEQIPILCYIDSVSNDLQSILEYKTGRTPWDQTKVDNFGQITFYATAVREITGKIPKADLIWAPTERIDGRLELTGEIKVFHTQRSLIDILKMKNRMWKAWHRMEQITNNHLF